ncbi:MAG: prolipoprotein diacylglyceryl transferase [Pleomorphochaeta sp.]
MNLFINFPSWISAEIFPNLPIRWYGLMYVFAFLTAYVIFRYQARNNEIEINAEDSQSFFMFCIIGLLLGARLFSVLIYNGTSYYWTHPWLIFWPFRNGSFIGLPGMSYHGGLVGAIVGGLIFAKKYKRNFLELADVLTIGIPLGYTFGRLGNFINGELWGRVSASKIAVLFPYAERFSTNYEWVRNIADKLNIEYIAGDFINLPRHPSQLYEALFEGIVLFLFMWLVIRKRRLKKYNGYCLSWYLIGYGVIRFFIEYFREPDSNLGFIIQLNDKANNPALFQTMLNISMGQIFCLFMIFSGIVLSQILKSRKNKALEAKNGRK